MEVQLIQSQIIKKSRNNIDPVDGYHVKKIKNIYYLIKTKIINYEFRIITKSRT